MLKSEFNPDTIFHLNRKTENDSKTIFSVLSRKVYNQYQSRGTEWKSIYYIKWMNRALGPMSLPDLIEKDCTKHLLYEISSADQTA